MPIPDRFNPRIWLRNIIVRVNRWLWKLTPAERAELARMWKEAEVHTFQPRHRDLQAALNEVYEVTRLAELLRAA